MKSPENLRGSFLFQLNRIWAHLLWKLNRRKTRAEFERISFSQEGEDLILQRFFEARETGFFIDIGAHHPIRFSNTYYFYKLGWRGLNIDAMPGSMELFNELRPEDINIEQAISNKAESIPFYIFKEKALNTFDEKLAGEYQNENWQLEEIKILTTKTLKEVLDKNLMNRRVDFISVDVEGFEMNILQSMDLGKFKPEIFLVEDLEFDFNKLVNNQVYNFMINNNYSLFAKTVNTVFYKLNGLNTTSK